MRHISEIMKELGFNKDASPEVSKAFIKNLIRSANSNSRPIPLKQKEQMSFPVHVLGEQKKPKKSS